MSVIVVGLNHRTAPVEVLERVTVPPSQLTKALDALAGSEHLAEAVVLSTCNRIEVYARATRFHAAVQDIVEFLADQSSLVPDDLIEHLYTYHDDAAITHLFGVAGGVDSMIVGEGEILGQVREAWLVAQSHGRAGTLLPRVFRHAVEVGKRSRTETDIGRHAASVASAAVALAGKTLGSLEGRRVLVVGAGEVGEGTAVALAGAGVSEVVVANRTGARAHALARRVDGRAIPIDDVADALVETDVLLCTTSATDVIVERDDIEHVMERRGGRALLIVDVAVPRDVDPGVGQVFGVSLLDIDDLKAFADASLEQRRREVVKVRTIVADALERFQVDRSARQLAPLVSALRGRAEMWRTGELHRFRNRLAGLDADQRAAVEALTEGIVNKLLHDPTVRLKEAAGTGTGELYADALTALFDLPELPERSDSSDP
ncbi:MAG TPA: glutamyl-tRNA reductase [Acidimicrobiia bacterium]|nr:glutamyl-tRNA reductase [Acidimicrobiia bacterium]